MKINSTIQYHFPITLDKWMLKKKKLEKIRTETKEINLCLKLKFKMCHWMLRDITWGRGKETIKKERKENKSVLLDKQKKEERCLLQFEEKTVWLIYFLVISLLKHL